MSTYVNAGARDAGRLLLSMGRVGTELSPLYTEMEEIISGKDSINNYTRDTRTPWGAIRRARLEVLKGLSEKMVKKVRGIRNGALKHFMENNFLKKYLGKAKAYLAAEAGIGQVEMDSEISTLQLQTELLQEDRGKYGSILQYTRSMPV